jgi:amino acid transporter
MLSALGAINGMILTAVHIYAVWGSDYRALSWLGTSNRRTAAPVAAIGLQAFVAVLLVLLVGTESGRAAFDSVLQLFGLLPLAWKQFGGGFDTLVIGSAPVFWGLTLLTCVALVVLRLRSPSATRPFSVPFFPLPVIAFCGACGYMLYSSAAFAKWLSLIGILPVVVGLFVWLALRSSRR